MEHKIEIIITDEEQWEGICSISSIYSKTVSVISKDAVTGYFESMARILKTHDGAKELEKEYPEQFKKSMRLIK